MPPITHDPTTIAILPFHTSTTMNTKPAFDANKTLFIEFRFICLTKSLTKKFILCNNIINNESITIHNVPITVSSECMLSCSTCTLWLWSSLSESAYESCACEWFAIAEIVFCSNCANMVLSCTSLSTLCFSWSHKCLIGFKSGEKTGHSMTVILWRMLMLCALLRYPVEE